MRSPEGVNGPLTADIIVPETSTIVGWQGQMLRDAFRLPNQQLDRYILKTQVKNGKRIKIKYFLSSQPCDETSIAATQPDLPASRPAYNDDEVSWVWGWSVSSYASCRHANCRHASCRSVGSHTPCM